MRFSGMKTLRTRILFTVGVLVFSGLVVDAISSVYSVRSSALKAMEDDINQLGASHVASLNEWVAVNFKTLRSLEGLVDNPSAASFLKQVEITSGVDTAYIGYADKHAVFSGPQTLPPGWDPTQRPWYTEAAASDVPVITEPYVDDGTQKLVLTFASAIRKSGAVHAVTALDLFMDTAVKNIVSIHPTPSSYGLLIDKNGKIVVHQDGKLIGKNLTELFPNFLTKDLKAITTSAELQSFRGVKNNVFLWGRPIHGTDWTLLIALDRTEGLATVYALIKTVLISTFIVLLVVIAALGVFLTANLRRLEMLRLAMSNASSGEGDLTCRVPVTGEDELAQIAMSFNRFVEKIQTVLVRVQSNSEIVANASGDISKGNEDLSSRTEQQARALEQTAAAMKELDSTVNQNAESAREANALSVSASTVAIQGGEVVSQVVETMKGINESSNKISDIISVIDGIAFQTNILALNAAVEAARAGEQGRGFAVVASEVRSLAGRSADAAKEIKTLISASVERVEHGSALVDKAGTTMAEVVSSIQHVADIMGKISDASTEQSTRVKRVGVTVVEMDQATQQNVHLVERMTSSASALKSQSNELVEAVGLFKLN